MNIFGVGGAELVLILLIMLIVAGPKRMIHWAYILGQYVGKFRVMWSEVVDMVQKEIDDAGVDVKLPKEAPTRQNINRWAATAMKPISNPLESTIKSIDDDLKKDLETPRFKVQKAASAKQSTAPKDNTPSLGTWGGAPAEKAAADPPSSAETLGTWSKPEVPAKARQERS